MKKLKYTRVKWSLSKPTVKRLKREAFDRRMKSSQLAEIAIMYYLTILDKLR
jgi:hypothetical protein